MFVHNQAGRPNLRVCLPLYPSPLWFMESPRPGLRMHVACLMRVHRTITCMARWELGQRGRSQEAEGNHATGSVLPRENTYRNRNAGLEEDKEGVMLTAARSKQGYVRGLCLMARSNIERNSRPVCTRY
jgi:hypothetical protein